MTHTATPWSLATYKTKFSDEIVGDSGFRAVAYVYTRVDRGDKIESVEEGAKNLKFIILACNAHDALVEACKANEQCIVDVIALYKAGCSNLVMDEAIKSLRDDALKLTRAALERAEVKS